MSSSYDLTGDPYGALHGTIDTFYLTATDKPIYDKAYNWSIREIENHHPFLDVVLQEEVDRDDLWEGNYFYTITKLTSTHMWWQVRTNGDNSIIMFRRHLKAN